MIKQNINQRLQQYKYLLIPAVPLVLFALLIFFIPSIDQAPQQSDTTNNTNPTPFKSNSNSSSPQAPFSRPFPTTSIPEQAAESESEPPDSKPGLQQKTQLSDGSTKYSYTSDNPSRPDITIAKGDETLFERSVSLRNYPVTINDYTDPYGPPEMIIKGPSFYGAQSRTYIYAKDGFAFVADVQNNLVLEQHLFSPMTTSEYIQKYGQDNL